MTNDNYDEGKSVIFFINLWFLNLQEKHHLDFLMMRLTILLTLVKAHMEFDQHQ